MAHRLLGRRLFILPLLCLLMATAAQAREWRDKTGSYVLNAELIAFDDEHVVLQRRDGELGMLPISQLSEKDREYLRSKEALEFHEENIDAVQHWHTRSGLKLVGRLVDYTRTDVTIQRRRGKMYVNNRVYENLPEFYRQLLPRVIEHYEGIKIPDQEALEKWLLSLRGQPKTYRLDGVVLELDNGDEYGVPFFVFSPKDLEVLKPGWESWLESHQSPDEREDYAFRLRSSAAAYAQNREIQRQIAQIELNLQAIQSGLTSAWEVTLYPRPGNSYPPRWVVVLGRDSRQATAAALSMNPGFMPGPVRRVSL